MFSPRCPRQHGEPVRLHLVEQLLVDQVDLAQVRLRRVPGDPRSVLHRDSRMGVSGDALPFHQADDVDSPLREPVVIVRRDGYDDRSRPLTRHGGTVSRIGGKAGAVITSGRRAVMRFEVHHGRHTPKLVRESEESAGGDLPAQWGRTN
jgi:hypothetical protein